MRRFFALCAILCFLLIGCSPGNTRPLLWYQESLTEVTLQDGNTVWRMTPVPGGYTAEILSPASAEGITLTVTETDAQARLGDVCIPVSRAMTVACDDLFSLFCLTEEELIGLDAPGDDPEGITCARFRLSNREIALGLTADGLPAFFDITIDGITSRVFVTDMACGDD